MELRKIIENGIHMTFCINDNVIRLINFSDFELTDKELSSINIENGRLFEYQETGAGSSDHRGRKHICCNPGVWFTYKDLRDCRNVYGRKIEVTQEFEGVVIISNYQFYDGIKVVRSWTEIINNSTENREIENLSSFLFCFASIGGYQTWNKKMSLYLAHNSWYDESRWIRKSLLEFGLNPLNIAQSTKRIYVQNEGSWSTQENLPMGCLHNDETDTEYLWEIEHNGSWYFEIAESASQMFQKNSHAMMITNSDAEDSGEIYFELCGPTEWESQWHKSLKPGQHFLTVPTAVAVLNGKFDDAVDEMVRYRRIIRRKNEDNEKLPVIFNDYMNCLFGDSTTEKLLPLIDAAAAAGCEYFVIDCGWYTDNNWWAAVGEWRPSKKRYPGGIDKPIRYIREKGMIPGLWLEIEVMGYDCPILNEIPKEWFFIRHGKKVSDQCRYQLDFRNPEVRKYADDTIDRMVNEYGVGYIKMDYNINSGIGTETGADSLGDGLLEHNRAYLMWLDHIFEKYPDLVIENCGSGGLRMDYAMLSRHSIQSSSDQTNYIKNACIAASSAVAVNPEQCAIWSYPLSGADEEETAFNMINAILFRIHQSGHLGKLPPNQLDIVKEGIRVYKSIRNDIKTGLPFWPIGILNFEDPWFIFGLKCNDCAYLAVWRIDGTPMINFLLPDKMKDYNSIELLYPHFSDDMAKLNPNGSLSITMKKEKTARLFKLTRM